MRDVGLNSILWATYRKREVASAKQRVIQFHVKECEDAGLRRLWPVFRRRRSSTLTNEEAVVNAGISNLSACLAVSGREVNYWHPALHVLQSIPELDHALACDDQKSVIGYKLHTPL